MTHKEPTLEEKILERFDEKVKELRESREVVKEFGYKTYGSDGYVMTVTDWGNIRTFFSTAMREVREARDREIWEEARRFKNSHTTINADEEYDDFLSTLLPKGINNKQL